MRDHQPVQIENFLGLWKRGGDDSCPLDHFTDCNNIQYEESSFRWRDGIEPLLPYPNAIRVYTWNQSLLILDANGNIYHTDRVNPFTPILHIDGMLDFGFVPFANRAYITPNGMSDEFIYVYGYGSSDPARKAGGDPPVNGGFPFTAANSAAAGNVEQGIHIFAVAYLTDTGFLTALGPLGLFPTVNAPGEFSVDLTNVPVSPQSFVRERWLCATKAIDPAEYTGNVEGYQFFFIPSTGGGRITDNTTTSATVSFFDAELLEDASHLFDLFNEIPNCAGLTTYHNRLVMWAFPQGNVGENLSLVRMSFPGEPEAVSQLDGLITFQVDGKPLTCCKEYRDVLYAFKSTKTWAMTDNGDVPSSWPIIVIDQGLGAANEHTVATIMDSGGIYVEYLIVGNEKGILLFNGTYIRPELTWKIEDYWQTYSTIGFQMRQILLQTIDRIMYIILSDGKMMIGDFKNGLDPKNIKWSPWSIDIFVNSMCVLLDVADNKVVLAATELR